MAWSNQPLEVVRRICDQLTCQYTMRAVPQYVFLGQLLATCGSESDALNLHILFVMQLANIMLHATHVFDLFCNARSVCHRTPLNHSTKSVLIRELVVFHTYYAMSNAALISTRFLRSAISTLSTWQHASTITKLCEQACTCCGRLSIHCCNLLHALTLMSHCSHAQWQYGQAVTSVPAFVLAVAKFAVTASNFADSLFIRVRQASCCMRH